jgi:[ribosomal protein S5]-alanine N-acetyltransferase
MRSPADGFDASRVLSLHSSRMPVYNWTMPSVVIPTLRSPRLTLRAPGGADYRALLALAQDERVARYMHEGTAPSAAEIANRVARVLQQWVLRGYGMLAVEDADGFVGRLGVFHPAEVTDPLLIYVFCRGAWGKGYATEGVSRFLDWMRLTHGPQTLFAHIDPSNTASARVAAKLGGVRTGTVQRGENILDVWTFAHSPTTSALHPAPVGLATGSST